MTRRRVTGFTLTLDGSAEDVGRILEALWREYESLDVEAQGNAKTERMTVGAAPPFVRSSLRGTIQIREDL